MHFSSKVPESHVHFCNQMIVMLGIRVEIYHRVLVLTQERQD